MWFDEGFDSGSLGYSEALSGYTEFRLRLDLGLIGLRFLTAPGFWSELRLLRASGLRLSSYRVELSSYRVEATVPLGLYAQAQTAKHLIQGDQYSSLIIQAPL